MQELSARAALVTAPEVTDGLTTVVSREEVTEALRAADSPLDLILDVTRFSNGDPAETRNLTVAWERGDLEELLRQSEGDQIVLTFDREAIRQAMEADVEAHGIREKALVLAVAAVAATGAAATASAQPAGPNDRAFSQPSSVSQVEIPYLSHGTLTPEGAISSGQAEIPYLSHGTLTPEAAAPVSSGQAEIPYLSHGILTPEAAAAASSVSPDDAAAEIPYLSHGTLTPEGAISSGQAEIPYLSHGTLTPEAAAAGGASASPDDRAVSMEAPAPAEVAAADSGISISAPSASTAAGIGAALALAITGAAFVVAGRRRMTPAS
jgi:hypothetical protein